MLQKPVTAPMPGPPANWPPGLNVIIIFSATEETESLEAGLHLLLWLTSLLLRHSPEYFFFPTWEIYNILNSNLFVSGLISITKPMLLPASLFFSRPEPGPLPIWFIQYHLNLGEDWFKALVAHLMQCSCRV